MFLSIVTRTHNRPEMLRRNMESVAAQTCQDLEHVILHDAVGRGLQWANGQYQRYAPALSGDYVLMLDDDNVLAHPEAVATMLAASGCKPHILQFMADVGPNGILPHEQCWMAEPQIYHVDGHTLAVRRDVWLAHVHHFSGDKCADYRFIRALWDSGVTVEWIDSVLVVALGVGSLEWIRS